MSSDPITATTLPSWPYLWAYLYPIILLTNAVLTFTPMAHTLCAQGGFPQPPGPLNAYVYLFAGCQFMVGLSVAVLEYLGEWRAVSVILCCALPMGCVGTSLSAMESGFGRGSPFWQHCVLMGVGTAASWRLIRESW